jgi:hypothetical protein
MKMKPFSVKRLKNKVKKLSKSFMNFLQRSLSTINGS